MEDLALRDSAVAGIYHELALLVDDFGVTMAADEYIHAFPCVGQVLHMIEFATGPPRSCRAVSVVDGVDHALQVAVARPEGHLHNAPSPVEGNAQLLCDLLDEVHVHLSGHALLVVASRCGEDPVCDGLKSTHGPPFGI